jgi:hypothetical protein
MQARIAGLASAVLGALLAAGGLGLIGPHAPQDWWCPGQPIPRGAMWNMATCHEFHYVTRADGTLIAIPGPAPQS